MEVFCPACSASVESTEGNLAFLKCAICGSTFAPSSCPEKAVASRDAAVGRIMGRFQIMATVGQGTFGVVYRAHDLQLDRIVAVKVPHGGVEKEREGELVRAVCSVSQLRHPGIVPLYEVGKADGLPFLVSHFADGVTLADWLSAHKMPPRQAAELMLAIADILGCAHKQGIVHRDLKPANIMLGSAGQPQIMDFGLIHREAAEVTVTVHGEVLGTPAYMSPEQVAGQGHDADPRSDIYSLGVILYLLLVGELPFRGNLPSLLSQVLNEEPQRPSAFYDEIPRDLEAVCLKAMAKEPARRYASAGELAADLQRFLSGEPVQARPTGWFAQIYAWTQRLERVRTAGVFATNMAAVLIFGNLLQQLSIAMGMGGRGVRPTEMLQLDVFLFFLLIPVLAVGAGTLRRHVAAIWAGVLVFTAHLALDLAVLAGKYDVGGLSAEPDSVGKAVSLLLVMAGLGWLHYLVALVACYSNPHAMRWSRFPAREITLRSVSKPGIDQVWPARL